MKNVIAHTEELLDFKPKTALCFISKGRVVHVPFPEIINIRWIGLQTVVYTAVASHPCLLSLQALLRELPVNAFFRVSRTQVIAISHMTGRQGDRILLTDKWVIATDYYRRKMIKALGQQLDSLCEFF